MGLLLGTGGACAGHEGVEDMLILQLEEKWKGKEKSLRMCTRNRKLREEGVAWHRAHLGRTNNMKMG
ncbi:hypothetical protein SAY86_032227 [Trapa natans]|uniref:Uncharacterized protein n=1 Tax=Trapa natans TaxID=22666 RepID=A0AAN7LU20_TRANT|nr:hypothetical protein SAY86_032227 [Trapa natans]